MHIVYFDKTNLYGDCLNQLLPYDGFRWLDVEELQRVFDALTSQDGGLQWEREQNKRYLLEVDLDYPAHRHESHSDLPLAVERMRTEVSWLSEMQLQISKDSGVSRHAESTKLIPNLFDKRNYVVFSDNLEFYLRHGILN